MEGNMQTCVRCKTIIPVARLEVLPETHTCIGCSGVQKYVGAMVYDHKTAGRLEYVRPENTQAIETLIRFVKRGR
jgi:hypothetical protein